MTPGTPAGIRLEIFEPALIDGQPDARSAAFTQAICRGFYDVEPEEADQRIITGLDIADHCTLLAAHDDVAEPPGLPGLHAAAPVGTYLSYPGTINVGGDRLLPVHQISAVTVSPTHRRRGILRAMITTDLQRAVAAGMPLAALTASEATIYGRFGFGPVTEQARFELDVTGGAPMRAVTTGRMIALRPADLQPYVHELLGRQHRDTLGSVSNNNFDYGKAQGRWQSYQDLKPHRELRAALHLDAAGTPDGFITYSFAGWGHKPARLNIEMLCAATPRARWEMIEYLGSHDLIRQVVGHGPLDDVLRSTLVNPRDCRITAAGEHLWLRILDLPAALAGRGYLHDGALRLRVNDPLGHAAGVWDIQVRDGRATATPAAADAAAQAGLDVRDLATLYLGLRSAGQLSDAGLLDAADPAAVRQLDELFAVPATPYCSTDF